MTLQSSTTRALTHRLRTEQSQCRLPSVVAGLVRDGGLIWSDVVGTVDGRAGGEPATLATQYRLGSITKTFVAVEVMRLRDEGRLDLGDRVGRHLPELDPHPVGAVTLAQLLTHTSGLQAETDGPWWERTAGGAWAELVGTGLPLRFTPGTRFHYSNVGFGVLGELVTRLRGVPWHEAVAAGVLGPLGLADTTTRPGAAAAPGLGVHPFADLVHAEPEHDAAAMAPAGQLWSTIGDLGRWAAFLAGHTDDVLRSTTVEEMLRPVALNDVPENPWGSAHGLGVQMWNVDGRRFAGHGGSMPGFLASVRVDLTTGDGVAVLTNVTSGLGTLATDLLELLAEHEPATPEPWSVDGDQTMLLDLTGEWFWGTQSFTLRLEPDGGLRLGTPGEGRGARFTRTEHGWTGVEGYYSGEPLSVVRDDTGRPVRLELTSFVFTRRPYEAGAEIPGGLDDTGWH